MVDLPVYFLVCMFGSSTWLTINAVWVELSLYTSKLPEGWSLPSYLAAVIQIACIGPLLYSILHKCTRLNINKPPLILCLLTISAICMLFLALFWESTIWIFGAQHSIAMIAFTFMMALVSATSNVLFLPYMAVFQPNYLTAYFVGMSFSSLVPSVLKLIQGVGNYKCVPSVDTNGTSIVKAVQTEPLFHIQHYNMVMFAWMCAATVSFAILHWRFGRASRTNCPSEEEETSITKQGLNRSRLPKKGSCPDERFGQNGLEEEEEQGEQSPLKPRDAEETEESAEQNITGDCTNAISLETNREKKLRYWVLIVCLSLICAEMNTIVPSVQSYATLAYSLLTYHLALTLSNLSHPLANFLPLWVKPQSLIILLSLTGVCTAGSVFIFVLALQSPDPIFRATFPAVGSSLVIGVSVVTGFLCSFLRTHITGVIRGEHPDSESRLFWCGFFMQVGSFLGACAIFPLVNVLQLFRKRDPCT